MLTAILVSILIIVVILKANTIKRILTTIPRDTKAVKCVFMSRLKMFIMERTKTRIYDLYMKTIKKYGQDKIACILDDVHWRYKDLKDFCDRAANVYLSLGLTQNDHIALFSETTAFYSQIWLAGDKIGLATGLINHSLRNESLAHSLNEVNPKLIIASASLAKYLEELKLEGNPRVAIFDENITTQDIEERKRQGLAQTSDTVADLLTRNPGWLSFDKLISHSEPLGAYRPKTYSSSDPILFIFTSGTTGLPKPSIPEESQHKVRLGFGNGMRQSVWKDFVERFKVKQIGEFYGATESCANLVNSDNTFGAVGFGSIIAPWVYPLHLVKADLITGELIRNPKTGLCQRAGFNEAGQLIGEVKMRAGLKFDGYLNKHASSKKIARNVFKKGDAWFMTGDLLVQDDYGYFYFKDRLGDTFRWRGENVSTNEVEAIISKSIKLSDCAVYGVEIPNCEGRAGMAAIVTEKVHNQSTSERIGELTELAAVLKDYLNTALPVYAHPIFLRFVDHIEMTGTFKMKKTDLVKSSYDPDINGRDVLFYFCSKTKSYTHLDSQIYKQIMKSEIKF